MNLPNYRRLAAEKMPESWANRFQLIFSRVAFEYMVYPDIAIAEIFRVLAPGGKAFLDISSIGMRIESVSDFEQYLKRRDFSGLVHNVRNFAAKTRNEFTPRLNALKKHLAAKGHIFNWKIKKVKHRDILVIEKTK